jgi:hypothetical protein
MGLTVIDQSEPLVVRMVSREDAGAVAELSGQLGYETSAEAMAERIGIVAGHPESQIVFVACLRGELVGWIEASISHHLQSPAYSLIGGLVVRQEVVCRGGEMEQRKRRDGGAGDVSSVARGRAQVLSSPRVRADQNLSGIRKGALVGARLRPRVFSRRAIRIELCRFIK